MIHTPDRAARVTPRIEAVRRNVDRYRCRCGAPWGACQPLTDADWDALMRPGPVLASTWDKVYGERVP